MVDTYTPNLRLTKPEINANDDAWAVLLNAGMIGLLDDAIAGEAIVDVTGGNVTLSEIDGAADESRAMFVTVNGTPGVNRFVFTTVLGPVPSKLYIVTNNSDSTIGIGPVPGTPLTIEPGQITMCYADEPSGGMFEVITAGDYIEVFQATMFTLTVDIVPTPGGGDVTALVEHVEQGSFVFLTIEEFLCTACPGGTFSVLPTSGTWDLFPVVITPAVVKSFPVLLYEDVGGGYLPVDSIITVASSPTSAWQITKVDGTPYTNLSDRQTLRPITVFYPIQAQA